MTVLSIAILDDRREAAEQLKELLQRIFPTAELHLIKSPDRLLEALEQNERAYSILFLGLNEPALNGLKTAGRLREKRIYTPIVFVSENERYYREAFEVFAFQYMVKPLTEERLRQAMLPFLCGSRKYGERMVHFRCRSQLYSIHHNRITYISSNLHNVSFHLEDGKKLVCRAKLGDFEEQLQDSSFLRCHQSFYINMEKIISMKNDGFLLESGLVPISRSYNKEARERYLEYIKKRS